MSTETKVQTDPKVRVDFQNDLNDLTLDEWVEATSSVWRSAESAADYPESVYEKLHPGVSSYRDMARLIRLFTKRGMLVLDPFCGMGSTLKAAALEGRRGIGIELSPVWAELTRRRLRKEAPKDADVQVWCQDVREAIDQIPESSVQFILTGPPYWGVLDRPPEYEQDKRLAVAFSSDERDLANIVDYNEYTKELARILRDLARTLEPGRHCAIHISDLIGRDHRYYPLHSDLSRLVESDLLQLQGIIIQFIEPDARFDLGRDRHPVSAPRYTPRLRHWYYLVFRRPCE
jgi:DNA modification methylase